MQSVLGLERKKDLLHKITAGLSHRRAWQRAWATFVSDTHGVASKLESGSSLAHEDLKL